MRIVQLYEQTPKQFLNPTPNPKNSPWGPPKVKNDHKIKSKSNLRIEENIENESCLTTWADPKTVVQPYSDPQTSPLGPQTDKNDPKIKSTKMSEFRES